MSDSLPDRVGPAVSQRHILSVCRTCRRHEGREPGVETLGECLADRLAALLADSSLEGHLVLRRVDCLSGCRQPGNVSLSAYGKLKLRFNRVGPDHAKQLSILARLYAASSTGDVLAAAEALGLGESIASVITPSDIAASWEWLTTDGHRTLVPMKDGVLHKAPAAIANHEHP